MQINWDGDMLYHVARDPNGINKSIDKDLDKVHTN